ncbi:PREDICTED: rRNA biogenesis protein rrp36 [Prunus mume]|uniref:rRNA biogenesis protein rrp36 n=1 Tax=Prunus mume TaxID=102107 RepID=A0ABM0N1R0_PRUMU|nr:PREDICTED: rRNA biogenesis protein rrp36 [Prunus mume]
MAPDQDDAVLPEGDLSSSSQDDEEEDDVVDDDEEEDDVDDDDDVLNDDVINSASPSTSSAGATDSLPVAIATPTVTVALPARDPPPLALATTTSTATTVIANDAVLSSDPKRHAVLSPQPEEKKPAALADSRRLSQRRWNRRHGNKGSHHGQNDTALFYDQIKSKLQLDFNKNQLVEKLRRLKKKYRNVLNKIASGKEVSFKSPHDQATFEISRKIWSNIGRIGPDDNALDDEDPSPNPNNPNFNNYEIKNEEAAGFAGDKKSTPRSRKRSRTQLRAEEKPPPSRGGFVEPSLVIKDNNNSINNSNHGGGGNSCSNCNVHGLIEETVKSCLSPLFKELLSSAMGGGSARGFGGLSLNPIPLSFGGPSMNLNFGGGEGADEKWRKQQILELEVYSKRLELVQNQIKVALEELRSSRG